MKRKAIWILGACLLLLLTYLYYPSAPAKSGLRIGMDPQDLGVDLYGKEATLVAIISDILNEMSPPVQIVNLGKEYLRGELTNGHLDGILVFSGGEGLPYQGLLRSHALIALGPILVVRKDSSIVSPKEIQGKSIGVEKNSPFYLSLNKLPQFRIIPSDTIWSLFELVLSRRVDAIVLDTLPAYLYLQRIHKEDLRFVLPPLTNAGIKLFALSNPHGREIIDSFNDNLGRLAQEEKIAPIFAKWALPDFPTVPPDALPEDGKQMLVP